jgi:hypothetical protein
MGAYDAVALLSGGLDSLLAVRLIEEQGLRVKCLHFISPFFGKPEQAARWRALFRLDIDVVDVGGEMTRLLREGPPHGFGKTLNPCVDCKILMLKAAAARMEGFGARCIVTGEVLGQRPMSQRRDTMHLIPKEAGVKDLIVRPLCAGLLPPVAAERSGLVDRERLRALWGRGRREQLALAARFALPEIPTPAGGCRLTDRENARRCRHVLLHAPAPAAEDFYLACAGRQFWSFAGAGPHWLCVGRTRSDNERLERLARAGDIRFSLADVPGPLGIGRQFAGSPWPEEALSDAAAFTASFSPRALRAGGTARVFADAGTRHFEFFARPARETPFAWGLRPWQELRGEMREKAREEAGARRDSR